MNFTFGQYCGLEIDTVLEIDQKYCEWIVSKIEKRKPEIYQELKSKLSLKPKFKEVIDIIPFGRYEGKPIESFIFDDRSYCEWLLYKSSLKNEYPKSHTYLKKYYELIYGNELNEIAYFYLLKFTNKDYIKPGITSNYIVKRIYSYTHTMNLYQNDEIDYYSSFVFKTSNLNLETQFLANFNDYRVDRRSEKLKIDIKTGINYLEELRRLDKSHEYYKKKLSDFIPYNCGKHFKVSFRAKINEFQKFRKVYEDHLKCNNLIGPVEGLLSLTAISIEAY